MLDTIAQIATPPGMGAVGIVRISGKEAVTVVQKIFSCNEFRDCPKTHTVYYGKIRWEEREIDEVLVTVMLAPRSYTMEDVVEINCHGGTKTIQEILKVLVENGIRPAEPGEFTKRAFLNGRIDLSQAEGVCDIINAKTELSRKASYSQLTGTLKNIINGIRQDILLMISGIEASIDYPEHDMEETNIKAVQEIAVKLIERLEDLTSTADYGKMIKEGIETAIVGKPNVGKSSLLNAILREDRAIVTDIPGTTRDVLQEYVNINDIVLKVTDTAGIRETADILERLGVNRSKDYLEKADLVLMVLDGSQFLSSEDIGILKLIKNKKAIIIVNKSDLAQKIEMTKLKTLAGGSRIIEISATENTGITEIYDEIKEMFLGGSIVVNTEFSLYKARHLHSLRKAGESLKRVIETIEAGQTEDLLYIDLKDSYESLGEITGETLEDDIIDKIFSEFCLGK